MCYRSDTIESGCSLLGVRGFECSTNSRYGTDTTWLFLMTRSESGIMTCARLYCTCTNLDLGVFNTRDRTSVAVSFNVCIYNSRIRTCMVVLSIVYNVNGLFIQLKLVRNQCCVVDSRSSSRLVMFTESRCIPSPSKGGQTYVAYEVRNWTYLLYDI